MGELEQVLVATVLANGGPLVLSRALLEKAQRKRLRYEIEEGHLIISTEDS